MIEQVWESLKITTNEPEFVAEGLEKNSNVKDVSINGNVVTYNQLTWKQKDE